MSRSEKELDGVTLLGNQNTKYTYDYKEYKRLRKL